ncbi:MAG TPA: carboxypeptidase-like regulatory domain-containing protein, partial [Chitinophagaceae bacterium]|nr:carboxypeptidase-like regulatory domain-containing protein [Chitinophagaceae bacterium]
KAKAAGQVRQESDADGLKDAAAKKQTDETRNNRAIAANRKAEEQNYRNQQSNVFRGRVTDQNNVGVPFANVTNLDDNEAGTYTDARGNFILTYPDSVLNVQVRSIGFEYNNVQLRNSVPTNQVILQDDRSLSEVVISNKKPNAVARSRETNMKLEEPEPADGWDNYDSYLVNNVKLPDEYVTKQQGGGEVQVSFEVDKNGEPVNFKIEKSLCKKCDQEAIRLIKEGPKWRRKAKNGRTTVTITF